jgi:hypothetical protein
LLKVLVRWKVDFREIFALVAHLEIIRILLAFAASKEFKLYQMDVKSTFLNGVIQEEVFLRQPPGFEKPKYPNRVYHGYGMLSLRISCYEHEYVMGSVDKTLFTLSYVNDFLLVQIYMNDIIFDDSSHTLVSGF